jgi:sucrose-6F-phosphate phosphohydrolase
MTRIERWLLVSDVDDTLLGDDEALARLNQAIDQTTSQLILVYNSSRPCASLRASLAEHPHLRTPHYLIGALGTEIETGSTGQAITEYHLQRALGWNREQIHAMMMYIGLEPHPAEYQTPLKASFNAPDPEILLDVRQRLKDAGLEAQLIFSGGKNLDIIPTQAGKGAAIDFLHNWLDVPASRVLVAGDSGNDLDMFRPDFRGIVVGNADHELKALTGEHIYHAQATHASGVLEGLVYWGVIKHQ